MKTFYSFPVAVVQIVCFIGLIVFCERDHRHAERADAVIAEHCAKVHRMLATYAAQLAGDEGPEVRASAADAFGGNYALVPLADEVAMCNPNRPVELTERHACWLAWLIHETPQRTELAYQCLAQIARHAATATEVP